VNVAGNVAHFGRKSSITSRNPIAQAGVIARAVKNSAVQVPDKLVRPERFELPASWFVARRSIQLSYGRNGQTDGHAFGRWWRRDAGSDRMLGPTRQGREYYHINYGLLGEFFGVPQSGSRRPSEIS
jgi:hypothetical protein